MYSTSLRRSHFGWTIENVKPDASKAGMNSLEW
jgi:hypothetical protein